MVYSHVPLLNASLDINKKRRNDQDVEQMKTVEKASLGNVELDNVAPQMALLSAAHGLAHVNGAGTNVLENNESCCMVCFTGDWKVPGSNPFNMLGTAGINYVWHKQLINARKIVTS